MNAKPDVIRALTLGTENLTSTYLSTATFVRDGVSAYGRLYPWAGMSEDPLSPSITPSLAIERLASRDIVPDEWVSGVPGRSFLGRCPRCSGRHVLMIGTCPECVELPHGWDSRFDSFVPVPRPETVRDLAVFASLGEGLIGELEGKARIRYGPGVEEAVWSVFSPPSYSSETSASAVLGNRMMFRVRIAAP